MIPKHLSDWNLKVIENLVQQGVFETDKFDFKESLPDRDDEKGKNRLKRTCTAFANSIGGFLIFGVKDDKSIEAGIRLVGIEAKSDFPEHFGNFPSQGNPSIQWEFLNPPITLSSGRVLHVVHIAKSWSAPHGISTQHRTWEFSKRTNKGNEPMSMEEIRAGFLNYYEKRIKLSLFKSEIEQVKGNASSIANANPTGSGSQYSLVTFNLEVINLVLADTYTLLAQLPDLVRQLSDIRMTAWIVNTKIEIFFAQVSQPLTGIADIVKRHNEQVAPNCSQIVDSCNLALASLNAIIELK